jgi:hypothetical protein
MNGEGCRDRDSAAFFMCLAENTLGWRKILSDGEKYSRIAENFIGPYKKEV